jgi:hypothetical protein
VSKKKNAPTDPVLAELTSIKRLLVFSLLKSGSSQKQVAAALGIDQAAVSRMFPNGIGAAAKGK